MSYRLLPNLKPRAFDSNGVPMPGGKLYTYIAGTTTPLATYTDSTGATPNTNPVVFDANGEANIWMQAGLSYKFVLTDSADVVQYTVDNVTSSSAVGANDADEAAASAAAAAASAADAQDLVDSVADVATQVADAQAAATAAAASQTAAASSATAAATSATNAASSATSASTSATNAGTSATNAASSATAASGSATAAASSATAAAGSASSASSSASSAASAAATAVATHEADTTSVHGISDTTLLLDTTNTKTVTGKTMAIGSNHFTGSTGKAAQFNASTGDLEASSVTATELGYVSGVTSAIQTQLTTNASNISTNSAKIANVVAPSGSNALRVDSTTGGYLGPRMTTTQRDALSSPTAGLEIFNSTTSKKQIYNGTAWQDVGSGSGSTNYITDGDAESGVGSWATYADAAATSPVDGTGGSPSATWTASTSSPLRGTQSFLLTKGASNRQGDGASRAFTIDSADQAKVLSITADYTLVSGTYADSDVTIWIYDVTNAVVIQPTGYSLKSVVAGINNSINATFQAASNSTSYRLIFHIASTSASAYTLKFDSISVGPQTRVIGSYISDWTSYTPVPATWTSNVTWTGQWRRVGGVMEVEVNGAITGAVTGTLTIPIPSGYTIDTSKVLVTSSNQKSQFGVAIGYDNAGTGQGRVIGVVSYNDTTTVLPSLMPTAAASTHYTQGLTATTIKTWANLDAVQFKFSVPITGWSSGMVLSSDTDTRVVAMQVNQSTPTATITSSASLLKFTTAPTQDTHGQFSTSTGLYTCPVSGFYRVSAGCGVSATYSAGQASVISVAKQGTVIYDSAQMVAASAALTCYPSGSWTVYCNAGETLAPYIRSAGTTPVVAAGSNLNYFHVERLSGPAQIAASELVACRYFSSTSTPGTTGTTAKITYATKDFDTHGIYSGGTVTIPVAGKYQVNAGLYQTAATTAANQAILMNIKKNSSNVAVNEFWFTSTTAKPVSTIISDLISCNAGDTLEIFAGNDGTTPSVSSSTVFNYFSIAKVG